MKHEKTKTGKTAKPYRSGYSATKKAESVAKLFHCPCDKIYILGVGELHLDKLLPFRSSAPISFPRGYSSTTSYRFNILGADIFVYQNYSGFQIQLNPSQFRCYRMMDSTLRAFLGIHYESAKIVKLHLFTDVKRSLSDVYRNISVSYKRRTMKYEPAKLKKTKGGKDEEITFTLGLGADNTDCIKVYDSHSKHGLKSPSTRIERQYSKARFCPIKHLRDLPKLIDSNPFNNVKLVSLVDTTKLSGIHKLRFQLLDCKRQALGLHKAIAEIRSYDSKHFNRDYRIVMNQLEKVKVNLLLSYRNKMRGFLNRRLTSDEVVTLKAIGGIYE